MGTDTELSKLPSVCCRWPGTKPHMKNVVNTSFRAAPLIIFWRELRSSVPSTHAGLGQKCTLNIVKHLLQICTGIVLHYIGPMEG